MLKDNKKVKEVEIFVVSWISWIFHDYVIDYKNFYFNLGNGTDSYPTVNLTFTCSQAYS